MSFNLYSLIASLPNLNEENSVEVNFLQSCLNSLSQSDYEKLLKCRLFSDETVCPAFSSWQELRNDFHDQINFLRCRKYKLEYKRLCSSKISPELEDAVESGDPLLLDAFIFQHYLKLIRTLQGSFQFTFAWLVCYFLRLQLYESRRKRQSSSVDLDELINEKLLEALHE